MTTDHSEVARKRLIYIYLRDILIGLITLSVTALIVINVWTLNSVLGIVGDTRSNTNTLVDCTTPGHKCYEQGRDATSGAVGTIAKVVVLAAYCVKNLDHAATQVQVQACINAGLVN